MRIAVGSDHAGYALKTEIVAHLTGAGHDMLDLGTDSGEVSVDYPVFGRAVGEAVGDGRAEQGVYGCASGIGIGMAANKVRGIRPAVVRDTTTTTTTTTMLARRHNDANVMRMGERTTGTAEAIDAIATFFATDFDGGRHQRRIDQTTDQERQQPNP
jgi:ribose 5-phosphate isomerase B